MGTTNSILGASGNIVSPGYYGSLSMTGATQNVLPQLQPYTNSGSLSDLNLGESSALGFAQATNTGNVSASPNVNWAYQVEQSQLPQQQQNTTQGESQTQGLLTQGAQAANNASSINNIGTQVAGALSTPTLASSGFAGAGTTGTIGTAGAVTGEGGVGGAVDFGTGTAGAVTGEGGVGASVDWGTGAADAGVAGSTPTWMAAGAQIGGAAAIGYTTGGYIAGFEGGNTEGGQIGGAIGAAAGEYFGGPPGAVIGDILGSSIGGLFGNNKPSDSTQVGGVNLGTGQINAAYANQESDTGSKFNQANANTRNTAQSGASNLAQWLQANGATPMNAQNAAQTNLVIKVGSRDGYQIGTQGPNGLNYTTTLPSTTSQTGLNDAVAQSVMSQYNLTPALQNQIQNINSGAFFNNNFNLQNALNNPSSLTNGQGGQSQSFATPTVNSQNDNGKGILQVPTNNPTGQSS